MKILQRKFQMTWNCVKDELRQDNFERERERDGTYNYRNE